MTRPGPDLPRVQRRRRRAPTAGARRCRPTPPLRSAPLAVLTPRAATRTAGLSADARGGRRPLRSGRDRDRLHSARVAAGAGDRASALFARAAGAALRCPSGAAPAVGAVGLAMWVAMFKSGIDPVIARPRGRPRDERLPARRARISSARPSSRAPSASSRRRSWRARRSGACSSRSRRTSGCSTACTLGPAT